jgi:hypothetical protein
MVIDASYHVHASVGGLDANAPGHVRLWIVAFMID